MTASSAVYQVSSIMTARQASAVPPAASAYRSAIDDAILSRMPAALRISSALQPHADDHGSWIIIVVPGDITVSSHPVAMKLAAEAAMPSTTAVTRAGWARSRLRIARPSKQEPPGELIRTVTSVTDASRASSASATSRAETPQKPPQESMGP